MGEIYIPGYEMIAKIREGGASTTWKVKQVSLNRTVTLEIVRRSDNTDDEAELAEIVGRLKKVAAMKHHGILQVLDVGRHDSTLFVVTEYVEGIRLSENIAKLGTLPEAEALGIASQVARALEFAWEEQSLSHGNIKPSNLLLADSGTLMVCALGMTRTGVVVHPRTRQSQQIVLGTPHYMSPEQVRGEMPLQFASDIYSLGATLYHLVTGRPPFHNIPGEEAMYEHQAAKIENPRDVNPGVSDGMASVITRMMMKEPGDRHATWHDVYLDTKRLRGAKGIAVRSATGGADSGAISTVAPPRSAPKVLRVHKEEEEEETDPAGRRERGEGHRSNLWLAFTLLKWAAVVVLWVFLALELLNLPPPLRHQAHRQARPATNNAAQNPR